MNIIDIEDSIQRLFTYIQAQDYYGYDPYDALHTKKFHFRGGMARFLFIQAIKDLPLNFRPFLGIEKGIDLKGLGLIATSMIKLMRMCEIDNEIAEREVIWILNHLKDASLRESYGKYCWAGHYFDVQWNRDSLNASNPEIVSTTACGEAFYEAFLLTDDKRYLAICQEIVEFFHDYLYKEFNGDFFLAYYPLSVDDKDFRIVYNATALGVRFLSRVSGHCDLSGISVSNLMDSVIKRQRQDGAWDYCIYPHLDKIRSQIDFHQGFIIDALAEMAQSKEHGKNPHYLKAMKRGAQFYLENQFTKNGMGKWRWPRTWPIDIHNQAQGIITFSNMAKFDKRFLDFAEIIVKWTIRHMQNPAGFFYYQVWPFGKNKIPYMRWNQAWMLLSLSVYLEQCRQLRS